VLALPWIVFARTHGGTVQFHQLLLFDLYATRDRMPWDQFLANVWPRFANDPWLAYASDPGGILRHVAHNLVAHVGEDVRQLTGTPLMLVALAGLVLALVRRERSALLIAQATLWSYLVLVPAGYNDRYALAVLPGYVALAAYAIATPFQLRTSPNPALQAAAALVLVALSLRDARASVNVQRSVLEQQPLEALECSRVLASLATPGDRVIARKPHTGWLAGVETEAYPASDDLAGLAEASRRGHARWLYLSASEALLRPRTAFLLDTTAVVPRPHAPRAVAGSHAHGGGWLRVAAHRHPLRDRARVRARAGRLRVRRGTRPAHAPRPGGHAAQRPELATARGGGAGVRRHDAGARGVEHRCAHRSAGAATFLARAGGDTLAAIAGGPLSATHVCAAARPSNGTSGRHPRRCGSRRSAPRPSGSGAACRSARPRRLRRSGGPSG
jgi:hypothetical protein